MSTPSPSAALSDPQIVGPLLIALAQTSCIIILGFVCMASGLVTKKELSGIKKFCGDVALPAIFFVEVANVNWGTVEFGILGGMFFAKVIVFACTAFYVCMRQSWTPREEETTQPNVLSTMGIFSIFATKSNDIALGVPFIDAAFSGPNTTKFSKYLFLFAPFQLLVLNVCGFVLLELGRINHI